MKPIITFLWLALALSAQQPVTSGQINTVSGNGRTLVTTTGAQTSGNCVKIDANGNHVPAGAACATGSGGVSTFPATLFSVSGTTASYATGQTANRVFATDNSGNVGSFALTTAMLPTIASTFLSDSSSLIRTTDTATVTNTMLAGSIANAKLTNSSLTIAGHSISLGGTQALACADLSNGAASCSTDATNASNISSGTLGAGRLPNPSASTLGGIESITSASHQWVDSISTSGVPHQSQPAFTDITGAATAAQLPQTYSPDVPPTSAGGIDDEFNGSSLSGWTQVNQGTSTTTVANGVLSMIPQVDNGLNHVYAITKSEPVAGGPWTVTTKIDLQETVGANTWAGICVYDGTKLSTLYVTWNGGAIFLGWQHWTSVTAGSSTNISTLGGNWASGWIWLRINNDGTNLNLSVSADGRLFNQIHTEAKTSFLANTNNVGLYSDVTATGGTWTIGFDYIRSTP